MIEAHTFHLQPNFMSEVAAKSGTQTEQVTLRN